MSFVRAWGATCFSLNNQTKCPLTPNAFPYENITVCGFMRERKKMSHMLTHNVPSPPPLLPPPSHLSLIPLSPSSHFSHSSLTPSHLSLISLSSGLSSLVHNFTVVVRQSHSFHQRDQERIFLGRGSLWAAFPLRINHVQTLMPCYREQAMR